MLKNKEKIPFANFLFIFFWVELLMNYGTYTRKIICNDIIIFMEDYNVKEKYYFKDISSDLDDKLNKDVCEYRQKGVFPTSMKRGIKVYIYSNDHLPIHFHVKSKQRYLEAKFSVDPFELIENNTILPQEKDIKYIKKYFEKNETFLDEMKEKFKKLNPDLDYKN